jgi:hypothetical protein
MKRIGFFMVQESIEYFPIPLRKSLKVIAKGNFLVLVFMFIAATSYAAEAPKKTASTKKVKEAKAATVVVPATLVAADFSSPTPAELEAKARETLNKKEWQISVTPIGNTKAKPEGDTLIFYASLVSSKRFAAKGFIESNYTLRTLQDGTVIWETMQKNNKGEIVFWKGELRGETMVGVLSFHPKKGGNEDFSFTTALAQP